MNLSINKFVLRDVFCRLSGLRHGPMDTNEIKAFFALKGLSLSAVALSIGEDRTAVSRVVNYERPGPRIRKKLRTKYRGLKLNDYRSGNGRLRRAA